VDKELTKVTFQFEDGKKMILKGESLDQWVAMCWMHSDYLVPSAEDDVLATNGIIKGFVSKARIKVR
jgi:hypothetical protein